MKTRLSKSDRLVLAIHNEVDSAEERILKECEEILSINSIIPEITLERKAIAMRELGFSSSETVKQYEELSRKNEEIDNLKLKTKEKAEYLKQLKLHYPLDKFITIGELERICTKYNLIHAPIANYIKDVPEKNVLDMKNSKPLLGVHVRQSKVFFKYLGDFWGNPSWSTMKKLRKGFEIEKSDMIYAASTISIAYLGRDYCLDGRSEIAEIDYSGFFIAAPKSHFDLKGVSKKSKFGFFNIAVTETKDPIVFQYCKNDFCRIITKWGTSDDQSYLDPLLTNETHS